VDALRQIIARTGLKGEDVAKVRIGTTNMVYVHCGWPYEPKETITAQMNLPYTAAVTLLEGNAFVDQYTDEKLRDPTILDLAGRVEVYVDPELDAGGPHEMRAVRAEVTMRSGEVHREDVTYRSGHWKNPLSEDVLKGKFRDLAGRVLVGDAVTEVERIIDNLENEEAPAELLGRALQRTR
jgi:2-methylcitrate dehydratase PrpD